MVRWQADEEGFLEQVDPFCARDFAAVCGGVLVADGSVELACEQAGFEVRRDPLAELELNVAVCISQPGDRGGHEAREGGWEHSEPEVFAVPLGQTGDLRIGEVQAPRDVICVFEQYLTGTREPQSAASAVEQTDTDLGLE